MISKLPAQSTLAVTVNQQLMVGSPGAADSVIPLKLHIVYGGTMALTLLAMVKATIAMAVQTVGLIMSSLIILSPELLQ
ncbi:MAG: hypothetical protein COB00_10540 [Alcanivorax sp.]|nr:MAG: hypothetical protein COB00_10540 [Alcanivorax sp.]